MEQTFVLKLVRELNLETGSAQGHIEEVRTGKALRFYSISELLAFLENIMKRESKPGSEAKCSGTK